MIASSAGRVALPATYAGARRAHVPFLYWTGIWAQIRTPAHLAAIPMVRAIERGADAVVTYGTHVSAYVTSHGAHNVHIAPQAVDNDFWSAPADALSAREACRADGFLALYAGRPEPAGKGLAVLLEAWRASDLAASGGRLALAGVPPGAWAAQPGVIALGSLDPPQLRNLYAAADVLVVPSIPTADFREPWGLVVNEAMNQRTSIIATDAVGAAAGGLVRDGVTGLVVPAGDVAALSGPCANCTRTRRWPRAWAMPVLTRSAGGPMRPGRRAFRERWQPSRRAGAPASVPRVPTALLRRALVATAMLLFLLVPAAAHANYKDLLKDACRDQKVNGTYSQKDYRDALDNLPADADQYTDCRAVLTAAQLAAAGAQGSSGGGGGGGGGSSQPNSVPAAGGAIRSRPRRRPRRPPSRRPPSRPRRPAHGPVDVGGVRIEPSALGAGRPVAASISDLPAPLLVALGLLALAVLAAVALVVIPRVRARRDT